MEMLSNKVATDATEDNLDTKWQVVTRIKMKTALEQLCRIKTFLQYLYSKNHSPFLTTFKVSLKLG